jgi:Transglycosylase SLT domain
VFRSIATIAFAIRFGHPDVTVEDATRYAVALQAEAVRSEFDPLTGVAIIRRESQFHPRAVSRDGEDYGLAQIRARHVGVCKNDKNPRRRPSEACRAVKEGLLDPDENIRVMGQLIAAHRKLCRQKVGHASLLGWLASYQGSNSIKENRWCTPSDGAWSVIKYRDQLVREVAKRPKEIQALDNALAQQAEERAKVADSREEASPAPVQANPDGPRGG